MITNPIKTTQYGVDAQYYYINSFTYDRKKNSIEVVIGGYNSTANGNAQTTPIFIQNIKAGMAQLPLGIQTALGNLGISIENVLISMPDYTGGTRS